MHIMYLEINIADIRLILLDQVTYVKSCSATCGGLNSIPWFVASYAVLVSHCACKSATQDSFKISNG